MKKSILLFSLFLVFAVPVFADHSLHAGFSFSYFAGKDVQEPYEPVDISMSGFGCCLEYEYVSNSGLVFKAGDSISSVSFTFDTLKNMCSGPEAEVYLGLGYAFMKNESMTLSLTGNAGARGYLLYWDSTDSLDRAGVMLTFGPEISFCRRSKGHLGFFVSTGLMYNVGRCNNSGDPDWIETEAYGISFPVKAGISYTF